MTGISPTAGPPPDDGPASVDEAIGAFDIGAQINLTLSTYHAHQIGTALEPMLHRRALNSQSHEIKTTIQTLYGAVLRLAASPQVTSGVIGELGNYLNQLAHNSDTLAAVERTGVNIEEVLNTLNHQPGLFDDGAAYALTHALVSAQHLSMAAGRVMPSQPAPGIPHVARQTLELSQRLTDPYRQSTGQDPTLALLLQGMAGSLHAVASRVRNGPQQVRLSPAINILIGMVGDASSGSNQFAGIRHSQLGARLAAPVAALRREAELFQILESDVAMSLYSLEADAESLVAAVNQQMTRFSRSFFI